MKRGSRNNNYKAIVYQVWETIHSHTAYTPFSWNNSLSLSLFQVNNETCCAPRNSLCSAPHLNNRMKSSIVTLQVQSCLAMNR